MKKLMKLLCLAVIVCVAYLALTTPRGDAEPAMKPIDVMTDADTDQGKDADAETDDIAGQMKAIGQDAVKQADEAIGNVAGQADEAIEEAVTRADKAIGDAVRQADKTLEDAAKQADKAIGDAVDSAVQGAKQGFVESLKESVNEFWEKLFP